MKTEHIQCRVDQQRSTQELIENAYANLIKVGRDNLTTTRIQTRIGAIQDQWQQFDKNHQAIQRAIYRVNAHTRRLIEERSYFVKDRYKSTYETYLESIEMMQDLLKEKLPQPETSVSKDGPSETGITTSGMPTQHQQPSTSGIMQQARLPRIDLPKFNGTLSEWLSFKGLYTSLVRTNPFISDVEKLQYLKTSLTGSAALLLKGTDVTADNFQLSWNAVVSFYDNERRLVNAMLKTLFSQRKMTKDSAKELESLYLSFNETYRTLEALNRPVQYYDDFLVFMMTQRLDPESIKAWEIHLVANCQSTGRCRKCAKRHHTRLHLSEPQSVTPLSDESTTKHANYARNRTNETTVLLATAQVVLRNDKGENRPIWALLDQGSEISLVSERIVQTLQLLRHKSSISIIGVGEKQAGKTRGRVNLIINPHFDSSYTINISASILPKLSSIRGSFECPSKSSWHHLNNLELADPAYDCKKQIDLIIGADYYGQLLEGPLLKGPIDTPIAQLTKLGWIISGPISMNHVRKATGHQVSVDHNLDKIIEKFWNQEELPHHNASSLSPEEQLCEDHFKLTYERDPTGRYILGLPFKTSTEHLGNSIRTSQRALQHLTTKFSRDTTFFKAYTTFINEYKCLKHMIQAPDQAQDPPLVFYLPHHGVTRESSSTTKLRVVFNGSCQTLDRKPLNELLCTGTKLQVDLFDVLLWFRQFLYIFSADIEKMYRQIRIHPEDWDFQRILWKDNEQILKYQLTTVTYGLACAPFQALRTIQQLIHDEGHKHPLAIDTMKYGRYVDDIFGGADTIYDAQEKTMQVKNLCMAGGFPLKKWVSNHPDVLARIPVEDLSPSTSIQLQDDTIRALGLFWHTATDQLLFKFALLPSQTVSKRSVLSKIAQLFDPLGLMTPIFIRLKIFMQELWAIKLSWDEELPEPQLKAWKQIQNLLQGVDTIRIPRWIGLNSSSKVEIHGFCDASQAAMAATVFIRTSDHAATLSRLLCSKTKVAPLKRMTIPRLELSSAVMLTKLVKHCQEVLKLNTSQCHLWTDSTVVQIWISSHPSKWKDFIHNRVCCIQETLPSAQWHHIEGKSNPADCATRGLSAEELKSHSSWWTGPEWLVQDYKLWPKGSSRKIIDTGLEERPSAAHCTRIIRSWELMDRYSSWKKLMRITAWCQRMVNLILQRPSSPLKSPITPDELHNATVFIIKYHQNRHFQKEVNALNQGNDLQRCSPLIRLCPFLDKDGLLRVGGRLNNTTWSDEAKHPDIVPRDTHVTKLLIEEAHLKTFHGSTRDTLAYLRQTFWILGGRTPVKSVILRCITCTRHRRQHAQYLMGQLPPSRVTPSRPFLHAGVDYAGPFMLKTWHRKARLYKAWIAVFVCFSTSAVHLEIVSDYSGDAFIAAYKRFISRRGICATITSDCGTTFQEADKDLKKLFTQNSTELNHIASLIAADGTMWKFNPPSAPHFGGKSEAAVKSMKYHLRRLIGETKLTYEQLSTIVTQIEAILNSRPLCALTDDPDDLNVLTPGHFLIGHALSLIPEPNLEHITKSRLSQWQQRSKMIQSFWAVWSKEYLQRHQARYKWNKSAKSIAKGDLVLIIDERYPPTKWPLGRITEVHPGSDNVVRVVTVKTSTSTFRRPTVKLVPLQISSTEEKFAAESSEGGR